MSGKQQDHITYVPKVGFSGITDAVIKELHKKFPDLDITAECKEATRLALGLSERSQKCIAENPRAYLEECFSLVVDDTGWEPILPHQEDSRPETPEEFFEYVKHFLLMRWQFSFDDEPPKLRKQEFSSLKYNSKKCLKKTMIQGFPTWPRDRIQAYSDVEDWLEQIQSEGIEGKESPPKHDDHSPDFRSVRWRDKRFSFTANQAVVVKTLWESFEKGTPEVGDAYLLEATDSSANRLKDVFRKHGAWGAMIVEGQTKGSRCLELNPKN